MQFRARFIGAAKDRLGSDAERTIPLQLNPELVHVGDLIRHPLFLSEHLYVVAREVDLVERCVTVLLDLLPSGARRTDDAHLQTESPFPFTPPNIDD